MESCSVVTTTLYLHAANSTVVGTLPNTEQSGLTAYNNIDPLTTNRSMNTSVGVSETSLTKSMNFDSTVRNYYCSRWVSDPLVTTSISANTWTVMVAAKEDNSADYFPGDTSGKTRCCLYIWRPSTGAKVANIFDATSATASAFRGSFDETTVKVTFTGSAQTAVAGDVLIFEYWATTKADSSVTSVVWIYYDGTTVNTTDNTELTNYAAFISTPQNLTFSFPPQDCTVTKYTIQNKFITIV